MIKRFWIIWKHALGSFDEEDGYDAKNEEFVDMFNAGIIDPKKVTRTAIENAASVAGMILTTECMVVDKPEEKPIKFKK